MKNLTGQVFNQLKALEPTEQRTKDGNVIWKCVCLLCGEITYVSQKDLTRGWKKDCGSHKKESKPRKHGDAIGGRRTRLLNIHSLMLARCLNPKSTSYKYYGAKGITVCEEWKNDYNTFKMWALQNGYSDSLSLDRIDSDGDYCPENCRWVTNYTQNNNKKNIKKYSFNGEEHSLSEWARKLGTTRDTLRSRIKKGWSIEKTLSTPPSQANNINTKNLTGLQLRCAFDKWCICDGKPLEGQSEDGYYIGTQLSRWCDTWEEANQLRIAMYDAVSGELQEAANEFDNKDYENASKFLDAKYDL